MLLLELKYSSEDNIPRNMQNALEKLDKCYDFLNDKKNFFSDNSYRIYLCASHPEHDTVKPFGGFIYNQDRLLGLNDKGLKMLYCNAVRISTPEYLFPAKVPHRYQFNKL